MVEAKLLSLCDRIFYDAGFNRGTHYYYRKNGSVFQCVSIGRGREDYYDDEVFLVLFPFWTARLSRIDAWPSFENAFIHQELFKYGQINWPNYGINISNEVYSYSGAKRVYETGEPQGINAQILIPYAQDKLIPFLNTVYDENSFKNNMININRHCRVFEELILQECLNANSIVPARKWLDEMNTIDSASELSLAEDMFNNKVCLEQFGFRSFEDVYNIAKYAVKTTHSFFWGKLIKAVESGDYKWIAPVISIEQEESNSFYEKYFNMRF